MTAALLDAAGPPNSHPSTPHTHTVGDTPARAATSRHGQFSGPGRRFRRRPYRQLSTVGQWQARTFARRPVAGQFVRPELAELVPAGHQPVLDRAAALTRFEQLPSTALLRSDSYATRAAIWRALVDHLDDETGMAIAGQAQIAHRASQHAGKRIARSTAGNHLRALADETAIAVNPGASKEALGADRDRASVYVVLAPGTGDQTEEDVPLTAEQLAEVDCLAEHLDRKAAGVANAGPATVDELGHLPEGSAHTRTEVITQPRKNAHFPSPGSPSNATCGTPPNGILGSSPSEQRGPARREQPERYQPRTRPEREIAIAWIAAVMGWAPERRRFAALIDRELPKITRPFFAAGWSPRAVMRAWEYQPDGTPWPGPLPIPRQRDSCDQPRIRSLPAVLTARLKAWRDPLGHPIDPPVTTEQPRRGRPRKTPPRPAAAAPPTPSRSAQAEAAIAAFRASNSHQRAHAAAAEAERQARQSVLGNAATVDQDRSRPGRLVEVYLRADIERQHRR